MFAHVTRSNETKGGICIKIELNPPKDISLLQQGCRFFVYSSNMAAVTSCEHTIARRCCINVCNHCVVLKLYEEHLQHFSPWKRLLGVCSSVFFVKANKFKLLTTIIIPSPFSLTFSSKSLNLKLNATLSSSRNCIWYNFTSVNIWQNEIQLNIDNNYTRQFFLKLNATLSSSWKWIRYNFTSVWPKASLFRRSDNAFY